MPARRTAHLLLCLAFALIASSVGLADWKGANGWPVERLARNVGQYVEVHPGDARGWFVLGRIHGLAFVLETQQLGALNEGHGEELPELLDDSSQRAHFLRRLGPDFHNGAPPDASERLSHLIQSIQALRRSIRLDPERAEAHLGLAYISGAGRASGGARRYARGLRVGCGPGTCDRRLEPE